MLHFIIIVGNVHVQNVLQTNEYTRTRISHSVRVTETLNY